MNGTKQVAKRMVNAQNRFIESVIEQFGFTSDEANVIFSVYVNVKAVKIDAVGGQFQLTHGAYWDKEVMTNALSF